MEFLIYTRTNWDEPPRARHQVSQALSKYAKVHFIAANKIGLKKITYKKINNNLALIIPSWFIDYRIRYRIKIFNNYYQKWLFKNLKNEFNNKKVIVINFDHTATGIFDYFDNVIYYCNDEFIRNYLFSIIRKYYINSETIVAKKSIFCIATTKYLKNKLLNFNKRVFEIKLGAPIVKSDYLIFSRSKKVRIALAGFSCSKDSLELINKILMNKQFELYIYGPVINKIKRRFRKQSNIIFKDILVGNSLYKELRNIDVGIAPYSRNDVNKGRSPNKLWLYLALGKPVVVTNIKNIQNWHFEEKFVYKANNDTEFINNIFKAYKEDNKELTRKRFKFAKENSWDKRIEALISIFNKQRIQI